jgi:NitT/TauT family transport system ATP-binding protein
MGSQNDAISIAGVSKEYSTNHGRILALEKVSIAVRRSEVVCVVGPSGCGKSTLLSMIAGFERPSSGRIVVHGKEIEGPGPDRGVVLQVPALFPWLSVWKNVTAGPNWRREPRTSYDSYATELVKGVGLDGFERAYPYQLSGGMQQRAAIARAMLGRPAILLLDEPFGALDAQTRLQMQLLVLDLWQRFPTTVLFVTHDVDEALLLGDRVLVFGRRPGRIVHEVRVGLDKKLGRSLLADEVFIRAKAAILNELFDVIGN